MKAALSTAAQIAAFVRDGRGLHKIEWRDAEGRLVARTLGVTCRLVKWCPLRGSLEVTIAGDDVVGLLSSPAAPFTLESAR